MKKKLLKKVNERLKNNLTKYVEIERERNKALKREINRLRNELMKNAIIEKHEKEYKGAMDHISYLEEYNKSILEEIGRLRNQAKIDADEIERLQDIEVEHKCLQKKHEKDVKFYEDNIDRMQKINAKDLEKIEQLEKDIGWLASISLRHRSPVP